MARFGRATFPALGTDAVVLTTDPSRLGIALDEVRRVVGDVDRTCSRFRDDSDLSRVNAAVGSAVRVDPLLIDALDVALRAARLTDGLVDPTVGEVVRVLGYDRDFASVGSRVAPVAHVARVPGWRCLEVDHDAATVLVPAGCRLDLGATAKAHAADLAAEAALAATGCGVLVSLGGDLRIAGPPPLGGWSVRVTDWQGSDDRAPGQTVRVREGGLATSSTTVRRWVCGDEPVHHVVDPRSGTSAAVTWRTVSVAAGSCVDANTAATAAIILGAAARDWFAEIRLPARLVRADGTVRHANGWSREAA